MVGSITLQNVNDVDIVDGDVLGKIAFAASSESGTEALKIAGKIEAIAEKTFDASNNATEMVFSLAADGDAAAKMTLGSTGLLTLAGGITLSGGTIAGTISTATQNSITTMTGLTTVGTIGTGEWQGTTIAVDQGGTGQTSYTNGQLLVGNTTGNTLAKATLTAGTGISITNGSGEITITNTVSDTNTTYTAGDGLTLTGTDFDLDAGLTTVTSIQATDLWIGEDGETKIDFEDANKINFYADNEKQLILEDGALYPGADNIIDLGKSDNEFKNAYFDGTVTSDAFAGPLTGDVTGDVSGSSGSCTGNAATVTNGVYTTSKISVLAATSSSELAGVISDETGSGLLVFATSPTLVTPALGTPSALVGTNISGTAANLTAGKVTVSDSTANTAFPVAFHDESNALLDDTGTFTYNPNSGTVAATVFSGSGASLTTLNGSNISSGTVAAARVATLNQDTTGNAATATALETARTIAGKSFDGTGNITIATTDLSDISALDTDLTSVSGSDDSLASAKAIKTYVDAQVTAQDLDATTDSGTIDIDLDSETLTVTGGTGVDTSATGTTITVAIDSTVATLAGSQTLTNKTLTSPVLSTGVSGTAIKDEDDMASDSATHLATQQSIKAYVDSQGGANYYLTGLGLSSGTLTATVAGASNPTVDLSGLYTAGDGLDLSGTEFSVDVSDFMSTGANNRVLTAVDADSFQGESNLTFGGGDLVVGGSTPSVTIGDAGAEDTKLVFDGNAEDFYIGLDDTDDDLKIGLGSAVGTTPVITMAGTGALSVGVDDTGYDLKLFGATAGRYWQWDESADGVRLKGNFVQEAVPAANSGTTVSDDGGATINIDWAEGNYQWIVLAAKVEKIIFQNMKRGGRYILRIQQKASSPVAIDWDAVKCDESDTAYTEVRWVGGNAPDMTLTANSVDIYGFLGTRSNGKGMDCFVIAQDVQEDSHH